VVARLDRHERLSFLDFRDEAAAALLEPVPEERRYASWHLVERPEAVASAGAAFSPLLERIAPRARPLAGLAAAAYRAVARRRDRLGGLVPDRPGPRRYP
jgi:predicted DCC family thiol-disulfide oxidoreductase YuxK